jgi:thiol-disulfide isomerase/thioredoxin
VTIERLMLNFYIQPGQTLAILLDWEDFLKADRYRNIDYKFPNTQFRGGALADLNRELKAFNDLLPEPDYGKIYSERDRKTPDEFKAFYDELMSEYSGAYHWLLETRNLSCDARAILENTYKIKYAMYLFEYEMDYNYNNRDEPLPVAFYDFLQDIPMNDKGVLSAPDFSTFINRLEYCGPFSRMFHQTYGAISIEKTYTQYLFEELGLPKTPEDEIYLLMMDSIGIIDKMDITDEQRKEWFEEYNRVTAKFGERHGEERWNEYDAKYVQKSAMKAVAEQWRLNDSVYIHELRLKPGIVYDVIKVRSLDFTFSNLLNASKENVQPLLDFITRDFTEPFLREEAERLFRKNFPDEVRPPSYPLPDTYEASIFREIIAPFKGKILLVDFWATSCGPCIYNIEFYKEMRKKYKDSPDAAFIFITDEAGSPQTRYDEFVAEQELTNTFRITADRYRYLRQLFRFNGIPRYILVDRNGDILDDNISSYGQEAKIQEAINK